MDGAAILTLAGTVITTAGTVAVAIITTKNRSEQKAGNTSVMESLEGIKLDLAKNTKATVATTRGLISQVYTAHKDKKEISEKTWRNVCDLYEAYKGITIDGHTPNSWCDTIVEEMKGWKKV